MDYADQQRLWEKLDRIEEKATVAVTNTGNLRRDVDQMREDFKEHSGSSEAHGVRAESRGRSAAYGVIVALLGAASAAVVILKFLAPLAKATP